MTENPDELGTPLRVYLRDTVDHEPCPICHAEVGEFCLGTPKMPAMLLFTHAERTAARREHWTHDDLAELQRKFEAWDKRMGEIYGT